MTDDVPHLGCTVQIYHTDISAPGSQQPGRPSYPDQGCHSLERETRGRCSIHTFVQHFGTNYSSTVLLINLVILTRLHILCPHHINSILKLTDTRIHFKVDYYWPKKMIEVIPILCVTCVIFVK